MVRQWGPEYESEHLGRGADYWQHWPWTRNHDEVTSTSPPRPPHCGCLSTWTGTLGKRTLDGLGAHQQGQMCWTHTGTVRASEVRRTIAPEKTGMEMVFQTHYRYFTV